MIETLTDAQEQAIVRRRAWFRSMLLSTERADRERFERTMSELYRLAYLPPPKFVWCESALSEDVRDKILEWQKQFPTGTVSLRSGCDKFYDSRVRKQVARRLIDYVSRGTRDEAAMVAYGQVDAFGSFYFSRSDMRTLAVHMCMREDLGVEVPTLADLHNLSIAAHSACGFFCPDPEVVSCAERPTAYRFNERGDLHCNDAPAVIFADDTVLWMLNGFPALEEVVMRPENQDPHKIAQTRNAELKRIKIGRFAGRDKSAAEGWVRYLQETRAICIHRRKNDVENVEEALFCTNSIPTETVLVCCCPSTARVYALEVPRSCTTAEEAQAYLHSQSGLDAVPPNVIGRS